MFLPKSARLAATCHATPHPVGSQVVPKNILMIGPTGCGKTEIARRIAKLSQAPFLKVEATKFTEVGFHGRDVDQIIRDLVEVSLTLTKKKQAEILLPQVLPTPTLSPSPSPPWLPLPPPPPGSTTFPLPRSRYRYTRMSSSSLLSPLHHHHHHHHHHHQHHQHHHHHHHHRCRHCHCHRHRHLTIGAARGGRPYSRDFDWAAPPRFARVIPSAAARW